MSPRWLDAAKVRTRQSALTARQASGSGCPAQASEPCNVAASRSAQPSLEDPKIWEGQETLPSVESVHRACVHVPGPGRAEHQTGMLLAAGWAGRVTLVAWLFQ